MNLPFAVESIQIEGSESASESAEDGERDTKEPRDEPVAQENLPVVEFHCNAPVEQLVKPAPLIELKLAEPVTEKRAETETSELNRA